MQSPIHGSGMHSFHKAKSKVLHLGRGNPGHEYDSMLDEPVLMLSVICTILITPLKYPVGKPHYNLTAVGCDLNIFHM